MVPAISPTYLDWSITNGVRLNHVAPAAVEEGSRGLLATATISPGEAILEVPEGLLLSCRSAREDPQLGPLLQGPLGADLDSHQVLSAHLLHEVSKSQAPPATSRPAAVQPGSRWEVYLKELPRSYTTLSCFPESAVRELQVNAACNAARRAAAKVQVSWRQAQPLLEALGVAQKLRGLAAWRWAAATLASRTMHVPWDEAGALTPLGDLLNHQPPPAPATPRIVDDSDAAQPEDAIQSCCTDKSCQHEGAGDEEEDEDEWGDGAFDADSRMYKLRARRRYVCGQQVFVSYGRHGNLELLELYGFVLHSNPHDTVHLPLELLEAVVQDPQLAAAGQSGRGGGGGRHAGACTGPDFAVAIARACLLDEAHVVKGGQPDPAEQQDARTSLHRGQRLPGWLMAEQSFVHSDGAPSWHLLKALRWVAALPGERRSCASSLAAGNRVSVRGDAVLAGWLRAACRAMLAALPTTAEADAQTLQELEGRSESGAGDGACQRLALQWRLEYKRVLQRAARVADASERRLAALRVENQQHE